MHKPELVGQSTHNKSKLNKAKKTKGEPKGKALHKPDVGEAKHAKQKITE